MDVDDKRPSPDQLLARITRDNEQSAKGRLKIFFGMAPGVGKTYSMLSEARRLFKSGVGVVIGVVETHGREETAALATGLEEIPRKQMAYKGVTLQEFDIDAALKLHPQLLLVDELAHTNAPGSRHVLRYQDVIELLDAGIDVYTTLNVQHLESLNDIVAEITGITVRERVPDSIFERADEVELVDIPPDELLKRLEEGKVYIPEVARRAIGRFFSVGNLTSLRELSLRRTTEHVHSAAESLRRELGYGGRAAIREKLMVAVGAAPQSANLVRTAYRMASRLKTPWIAVHVENTATDMMPAEDRARVEAHLSMAERLGAEILIVRSEDVSKAIISAARDKGVGRLVIGKPTAYGWRNRLFGSPVDALVRESEEIDVLVTSGLAGQERKERETPVKSRVPWFEYLWAFAAVALATMANWYMRSVFSLSDFVLVYMVAILHSSYRLSRWPAIFSSLLSILAVDFFFVPPHFTFAVSDARNIVTFTVLFFVGLIVNNLTIRVRRQAAAASDREKRTAALYSISRQLGGNITLEEMCMTFTGNTRGMLGADAAVWLEDEKGVLACRGPVPSWAGGDGESGVYMWVHKNGRPAGRDSDTLPAAKGLYFPIGGEKKNLGVIGIHGSSEKWMLTASKRQVLEVMISLLAQAVERKLLSQIAEKSI